MFIFSFGDFQDSQAKEDGRQNNTRNSGKILLEDALPTGKPELMLSIYVELKIMFISQDEM